MARSQAYNLVWIHPRFASEDDQVFCLPFQDKTQQNILAISAANPMADVRLWVDSKRLTKAQMTWLQNMTSDCPTNNLSVQDLRTISSYNQCPLYNKEDTNPNWRADKHSLIWRQVDAARILACLDGQYSQSFYSDVDITNLCVSSKEVLSRLLKHGIIVSSPGGIGFENQMLGFDERCRGVFNLLYIDTLKDVSNNERNGYQTLVDFLNFHPIIRERKINIAEIGFVPKFDGTAAVHPSEFRRGMDAKCPSSSGRISRMVFNIKSLD